MKALTLITTGLITGLLSMTAAANTDTEVKPQFIYQSRSINHNIFSYLSKKAGDIIAEPQMIYVSRAYGPAIYSYQHTGTEKTVALDIEYVNKAYNPAIYSYDSFVTNGEVNMLPIKIVD